MGKTTWMSLCNELWRNCVFHFGLFGLLQYGLPMDDVINKQIGYTLKVLRCNAKLTQAQLAERMGQPQSYISKLESAFRSFHMSDVFFYAPALDMRPHELTYLICDSVEAFSNAIS